jgi:hypothetical protein
MKLLDVDALRLEWTKQLFREGGRARHWLAHLTPHQQSVLRARALGLVTKEVGSLPEEGVTDHALRMAAKHCHDSVLPTLEKFYLKDRHRNEYREYLKSIPAGNAADVVPGAHRVATAAGVPVAGAAAATASATDAIAADDDIDNLADRRAAELRAVRSDPMFPPQLAAGEAAEIKRRRDAIMAQDPSLAMTSDLSESSAVAAAAANVQPVSAAQAEGDIATAGHRALRTAHLYRRALEHAGRQQRHADALMDAAAGPYGRKYMKAYRASLRRWKRKTRAVKRLRRAFVRNYNQFVEGVKSKRSGSKAYKAALVQLTAAVSAALGVPPKPASF